jgi:hypothetical protein
MARLASCPLRPRTGIPSRTSPACWTQ